MKSTNGGSTKVIRLRRYALLGAVLALGFLVGCASSPSPHVIEPIHEPDAASWETIMALLGPDDVAVSSSGYVAADLSGSMSAVAPSLGVARQKLISLIVSDLGPEVEGKITATRGVTDSRGFIAANIESLLENKVFPCVLKMPVPGDQLETVYMVKSALLAEITREELLAGLHARIASFEPSLPRKNRSPERRRIETTSPTSVAGEATEVERLLLGVLDLSPEGKGLGRTEFQRRLKSALLGAYIPANGFAGNDFSIKSLPVEGDPKKLQRSPYLSSLQKSLGRKHRIPLALSSVVIELVHGSPWGEFQGFTVQPNATIKAAGGIFRSAGPGGDVLFSVDHFVPVPRPDRFIEYRLSSRALKTFRRAGVLIPTRKAALSCEVVTAGTGKVEKRVPIHVPLKPDGETSVVEANGAIALTLDWDVDSRRVWVYEIESFRGDLPRALAEMFGLGLEPGPNTDFLGATGEVVQWGLYRAPKDEKEDGSSPP